MTAAKAAPASRAREGDHVHRGRNASAPPATQLQLQVLPLPRQQGQVEQRPLSPLAEVFVSKEGHENTSAAGVGAGEDIV